MNYSKSSESGQLPGSLFYFVSGDGSLTHFMTHFIQKYSSVKKDNG